MQFLPRSIQPWSAGFGRQGFFRPCVHKTSNALRLVPRSLLPLISSPLFIDHMIHLKLFFTSICACYPLELVNLRCCATVHAQQPCLCQMFWIFGMQQQPDHWLGMRFGLLLGSSRDDRRVIVNMIRNGRIDRCQFWQYTNCRAPVELLDSNKSVSLHGSYRLSQVPAQKQCELLSSPRCGPLVPMQ